MPTPRKRLLVISYRCPPEPYPLAIRVRYFLEHLSKDWDIDVLTAAEAPEVPASVQVHRVPPAGPIRALDWLRSVRLGKIADFLAWPDPYLFWVWPALQRARALIAERPPDAIVLFMMPFSTGLLGLLLKRLTGLPLILNLNDSITCSDMNPTYPSWMHQRGALALENAFARSADALVYVSARNLRRVRDRQRPADRHKFHLIRRGARPMPEPPPQSNHVFRIVYTGGMSGWYPLLDAAHPPSLLKRLYRRWTRLGQHTVTTLDHRTHSPVFVGHAVKQVLDANPDWQGRVRVDIYGNTFPDTLIEEVLKTEGLRDIVHVHGRIPHAQSLERTVSSHLLFLTLPDRPDGTPGGRISAKTYEYLMTDRPILAAVPPGENQDYLRDKPGVYLAAPHDIDAMAAVIEPLAAQTFAQTPPRVNRTSLHPSLHFEARAEAFDAVLHDTLGMPPLSPEKSNQNQPLAPSLSFPASGPT